MPAPAVLTASFRNNLHGFADGHHFSISRRVAWAAIETMMVAHEGQAIRRRTLRFSV
jgi:hypothetical protein